MREREEVLEEFGLMEYDGSIWQIHSESVKSRGAYGATVCAMADRIRELEAALAAAPRVRVLDEYRVYDAHGGTDVKEMTAYSETDADDCRWYHDKTWPDNAPHRVVRVALVDDDAPAAAGREVTEAITVTQDDDKITVSVGPVTEAEAIATLQRHGWTEQASLFGSFRSLVAPDRALAAERGREA